MTKDAHPRDDAPAGEHPHVAVPTIEERVESARVRSLFRRSRMAGYLGVPFLVFLLLEFWGDFPHRSLIGWALFKITASAVRIGVDRWYVARQASASPAAWSRRFLAALVLDGFAWSLLAVLFAPHDGSFASWAMIGIVIGLGALAGSVGSTHDAHMLAFLLPLLVPPALFHFAHLDRLGGLVGLLLTILMAVVIPDARRMSRDYRELLTLRFQMAELAEVRATALSEARRLATARSQFLATMSHEMRTPLHGILGLVRLLREGQLLPEQHERSRLIEQQGQHLLGVINDVLDFSRIDAGRMALREAPFDLSRVLGDAASLFVPAAEEAGQTLTLEDRLGPGTWRTGDAARVRQIVINLVGNAVKFCPRGTIRLRLDEEDGHAVIVVADDGPGIAARDLPHIFEAFRQAESSFARPHPGSGLGLTISRQLALAMGGSLECDSEPGRGATFTLRLPLPPCGPPPAEVNHALGPGPLLRGRVLLAEDNEINVLVARATLLRLDLDVVVARNGDEAIARWRDDRPDAILMDLHMPRTDGFAAARAIRALELSGGRGRTPIIAASAATHVEEQERCRQSGMDDFLVKPFGVDALRAVLLRFLPPADAPAHHVPGEPAAGSSPGAIGELAEADGVAGSSSKARAGALDARALERLRSVLPGEEEWRRLVQLHVETSTQLLARLRCAFAEANRVELHQAAHSLCSSSAMFGASRVAALARRIEAEAPAASLESLGAILAELGPAVAEAHHLIERLPGAGAPTNPPGPRPPQA